MKLKGCVFPHVLCDHFMKREWSVDNSNLCLHDHIEIVINYNISGVTYSLIEACEICAEEGTSFVDEIGNRIRSLKDGTIIFSTFDGSHEVPCGKKWKVYNE